MSRPLTSRLLALGSVLALCHAGLLRAQSPAPAQAPGSSAEAIAQEVRGIFEQSKRAVVKIEATDRHGSLSGSGFFIDPNGILFTSYTVGGEAQDITVTVGNDKFPARRLMADPRSGIAILKIDAQTPFLSPGKSSDLQLASPVITIGYPMDLPLTPTFGTVAGFDLKYLGRFFATKHIRANVQVQRGEGGAPLLNMRGEVVGILISSIDAGSASFALPIEAAEKVRKDFVRFGQLRPGWMGLKFVQNTRAEHASRARIDQIFAGGAAQKAGLQPGDTLLKIGDRPIQSIEDVLDASFFLTADDDLTVKVVRNDEELEFQLKLQRNTPTSDDASISVTQKRLQILIFPEPHREPPPETPGKPEIPEN